MFDKVWHKSSTVCTSCRLFLCFFFVLNESVCVVQTLCITPLLHCQQCSFTVDWTYNFVSASRYLGQKWYNSEKLHIFDRVFALKLDVHLKFVPKFFYTKRWYLYFAALLTSFFGLSLAPTYYDSVILKVSIAQITQFVDFYQFSIFYEFCLGVRKINILSVNAQAAQTVLSG